MTTTSTEGVDHAYASQLAKGRITLAEEGLEGWKRRLAATHHNAQSLDQEIGKLNEQIEAAHADSGSGIMKLRDQRCVLTGRKDDLLTELPMLEAKVREAEKSLERVRLEASAAERARLQEEGTEVSRKIRARIGELGELYVGWKRLFEEERRLQDFMRGAPVDSPLPTFAYSTAVDSHFEELIQRVVGRCELVERELENRRQGRPGGNVPGEYSLSQQRPNRR